ncbi:MAG: M1 family aminopeptidase [Bacteroidetes bacterium]|nr:M1 family aminopeptidase [Bacteroidota bacterium]
MHSFTRTHLIVLLLQGLLMMPSVTEVIAQTATSASKNVQSVEARFPAEGPESKPVLIKATVSGIPHAPRWADRASRPGMQGSSLRSDARRLQSAFDVSWYHLSLDLSVGRSPELVGSVRVKGKAVVPIDTLALDLADNMVVDSVRSEQGEVLALERTSNRLWIQAPATLQPGDTFSYHVFYHGNPQYSSADGGYTSGTRSGQPYIWTLSEPYGSLKWWPTEDHPADKADSVRITVTVDAPMSVGSNGLLIEETDLGNGRTLFDWLHRYPISTYLVSVTAGDYDRTTQMYDRPQNLADAFGPASFPIEHYYYRGTDAYDGIGSTSGWRLTPQAMAALEDWFGPYPFAEEKYGHAHSTFRGGMEHQTMSTMGNIGIELIAHELTHQWTGDSITPSHWRDLWLNEGFATLGEMLVFETDPAFSIVHGYLSNLYYSRARQSADLLVLEDTTNASDMFRHSRVYAKGWMVLRMIRGIVGDDTFRTILRTWLVNESFAYANATTADFRGVVEHVTGESWFDFFSQWVTDGWGHPTWAMGWEDASDGGNHVARVSLDQIHTSSASNVPIFETPLQLVVTTTAGEEVHVVSQNKRTQTFLLALAAKPTNVRLDPSRWVLRGDTQTLTNVASEPDHTVLSTSMSLEVAPHPATGLLRFRVLDPGTQPLEAEMFDLTGRRVWRQTLYPSDAPLRVSAPEVPSGRYLLRVLSSDRLAEQLVIIQRDQP